jgi:hypothetical protein
MMILKRIIFTTLILLVPIAAFAEESLSGCNPIKLMFVNADKLGLDTDNVEPGTTTDKTGKTEGTAVISCNDLDLALRDTTIVHMMQANDDGFCYSDKACGNLYEMGAFFKTGVSYGIFSSFGYYMNSTPLRDFELGVHVLVGFNKFERYCTDLAEPICFPYER